MDGEGFAPARRQRPRTLLTTGAVVAAVVIAAAAGATLTADRGRAAPEPVGPSPSATPPSPTRTASPTGDARARQITRDGRLVAYAVNAKGALLTVREFCESWDQESSCGTAWQLQGGAGTGRGLVRSFAGAEAAGDHFVVMSWNGTGVVLDDTGRPRPLQPAAPRTVAAGDALVRLRKTLGVVDPVTAQLWPLPAPAGVDGWVQGAIAGDGTVWATPSVPAPPIDVLISWLEPDAGATAWQHHAISTSFRDGSAQGLVAVANDHVAALSMHDGVDVATYGVFAVTTDGGASWSHLHPSELPFDNVDAMAATSAGTLYVASMDDSGEDRVFRSTDSTWTRFTEVPEAAGAYQLVAAGDRVLARRGTLERAELFTLDDAGHATRRADFH